MSLGLNCYEVYQQHSDYNCLKNQRLHKIQLLTTTTYIVSHLTSVNQLLLRQGESADQFLDLEELGKPVKWRDHHHQNNLDFWLKHRCYPQDPGPDWTRLGNSRLSAQKDWQHSAYILLSMVNLGQENGKVNLNIPVRSQWRPWRRLQGPEQLSEHPVLERLSKTWLEELHWSTPFLA